MTRRPATWKVVTFGAALTGLGVAGAGVAIAGDDSRGPLPGSVSVAAADAPADGVQGDASPESADSPNESATDSPADVSPESADSPNESVDDTPDVAPASNGGEQDSADSPDTRSADVATPDDDGDDSAASADD